MKNKMTSLRCSSHSNDEINNVYMHIYIRIHTYNLGDECLRAEPVPLLFPVSQRLRTAGARCDSATVRLQSSDSCFAVSHVMSG